MQPLAGSAIVARGLGKSYRIATSGRSHDRLTEALVARAKDPFHRREFETFEALHDMSFDIPWGEAVGIVGRNGAGKSTLLKILTRITAPTTGRVELGGRVGSLLEVGTGFHPELTGRENIFLNGSLLGMGRSEIRRRFDDIVRFSGIEKFLETPVKRFSSGMYVRLAFAVAAHLETEILAIDEVLAVGDAEFQRKSLDKMRDVAKDGRAVLYVSHQMQTVTALCTSAMFIDRGRLVQTGSVDDVMTAYRDSFDDWRARQVEAKHRPGTGEIRLERVDTTEVRDPVDDTVVTFAVGANPEIVGKYFVSCHIVDHQGAVVAQCDSRLVSQWFDPSEPRSGELRIKNLWLKPGTYTIDAFVCQNGVFDGWRGAAAFEVLPHLPYPDLVMDEGVELGAVFADFDYEAW
ncbi:MULTISPECIES: ABC transporter ATP-binding protein [Isoptericola]|uniref:ABC transporter ATP-binding protein n=1 Tax=Isoptericola TaxID=254250 RepID=UPI001A9C3C44|nr:MULTISPECIES: polysaccharide ABC transporter ATP-binding protein [Isoptericola]